MAIRQQTLEFYNAVLVGKNCRLHSSHKPWRVGSVRAS
jgi:hypothetical protein